MASFGFGGSNSHVILDDAYHYMAYRGLNGNHYTSLTSSLTHVGLQTQGFRSLCGPEGNDGPLTDSCASTKSTSLVAADEAENRSFNLLVFSAGDEKGLQRLAEVYEEYFNNHRDEWQQEPGYASHLAYTLAMHRSSLPWKSFAVTDSVESLTCLKSSLAKPLNVGLNARTVLVFTGQGAQYHGMGAGLRANPSFTRTIDRFDEELALLGCTWSVSNLLEQHESVLDINDPEYSQAASTALQMAQYDLLRDLGIQCALVVGHSSGEIAAAYAAGALSLRSACRVSYFRGRCASRLKVDATSRPGAMMSVDLPQSGAQEVLTRFNANCPAEQALYIACINSPFNVTISGDDASISLLQASLASQKVRTRKLSTGVAYHCPHMENIAQEYAERMGLLEPPAKGAKGTAQGHTRPIMVSSVSGDYIHDLARLCTPKYWVRNLLSPVQFTKAMSIVSTAIGRTKSRKLGEPKLDVQDIIEIGPRAALRRPILDCLDKFGVTQSKARYHSVLVRGSPATKCLLNLVGELYARGYAVNVQKANAMGEPQTAFQPRFLAHLPSYPFNHAKSYWSEPAISRHARRRNGVAIHELLGVPVPDWNALEPRWRKFFDLNETPWIGDHQVNGRIIYPAAGMLAMAIEGAAQVASRDSGKHIAAYQIRDASFVAPISISRNERAEAQLHMRFDPAQSDQSMTSFDFSVYSADGDGWFQNCRGTVQVLYEKVETVSGRKALAESRQRENLYYQQKYSESKKNCSRPVGKLKMYDQLYSNGLQYGPAFQPLDDLAWDGENAAVGSIKCFQWKSDSELSQHDWQPHVVHPTLLDGAGQLPWVSLTRGGEEQIANGAAVTRIQYAWIASAGLSYPGATEVRAYCEAGLKGTRGTDSSIFGLDASGNLVLRVLHMETTAVGGDETSALVLQSKKICYEMAYRPDLDCLDSQQLETFLASGLESQEDAAVSFFEDLELALFYFATSVLQGGGNPDTPKKGRIESHLTKYVAWLTRQVQLYHVGQLPNGRTDWAARTQDTAAMEKLVNRLERTNAQGRFLVSVGRKLSSIIRGETDPLEVMFQTGLAEEHYQAVCDQIKCCKQLKEYLSLLSHKKPQAKVIEVGAGTGSITGHVLAGLGTRFSRYDYTDVSASFFEQARSRFSDPTHAAKMHYNVLDIERDPGDQGFVSNSYDIVVAAWVLHATRDLATTISNVRKLLKPGGKLVLLEITEPGLLRNGFAFGTLPGWWLSTEPEREWSPCLSAAQWAKFVTDNGFSGFDVVLPDFSNEVCRENSILIATAAGECSDNASTLNNEVTLVTAPRSSLQEAVAQRLQASLGGKGWGPCSIISIDDPALPQKMHTTFLILTELDSPYLSLMDAKAFTSLQILLSRVQRVLWVSSSVPSSPASAEQHMIRGLTRVLFTEKPGLVLAILSFESASLDIEAYSTLTERVFVKTFHGQDQAFRELEFVERGGTLLVPRVFDADTLNQEVYSRTNTLTKHQALEQSKPLALVIPKSGLLDSIRWEEDAECTVELDANEVEIRIEAMGVNFRDLLVMLGKYSASTVGCECAGVVTRVGANCDTLVPGDRVCACFVGCSKTHARCHYKLAVRVPESLHLSMAEAASLPCTGVTAYHSLITLARLGREDSILIHSATGGTGQMAVQIAKSIGAEIFVTVGNEDKRRLVSALYDIPDDHIFSSRNVNFARDIHRMTDGRGVDVVLNSLSKEALLASWECIAPFGRFVELGKMDIEGNSKLPMSHFSKNVAFYAVAVDHLSSRKPAIVGSTLQSLLDMMERGMLKVASPLKTYAISELEDALRFMQSGHNTGKMVLTFNPSDVVPVSQLCTEIAPSETNRTEIFYRQGLTQSTLARSIPTQAISSLAA